MTLRERSTGERPTTDLQLRLSYAVDAAHAISVGDVDVEFIRLCDLYTQQIMAALHDRMGA